MTNPAATLEAILTTWAANARSTKAFRELRVLEDDHGLHEHLEAMRALLAINEALDALASNGEDVDHLEDSFHAWIRMVFGTEIAWGAQANTVNVANLYPQAELSALKSLRMTLNQGRRVPRAEWSTAWRERVESLEKLLREDDSLQPWLREHLRGLIDELRGLLDADATEAEMQTTLRNTATAMREAEAQSTSRGKAWAYIRDQVATPIGVALTVQAFNTVPAIGM